MTEAAAQGADNPDFAKGGAWLSADNSRIFTAQNTACQGFGSTGWCRGTFHPHVARTRVVLRQPTD